jgi:hypothetical protein
MNFLNGLEKELNSLVEMYPSFELVLSDDVFEVWCVGGEEPICTYYTTNHDTVCLLSCDTQHTTNIVLEEIGSIEEMIMNLDRITMYCLDQTQTSEFYLNKH